MNHQFPRHLSRYCGKYKGWENLERLLEILQACEQVVMSSKDMDTAEDRFELAIECYHQLRSLLHAEREQAELDIRMTRLAREFREDNTASLKRKGQVIGESVPRVDANREATEVTPAPGDSDVPESARAPLGDPVADGRQDGSASVTLESGVCRRVQLAMLVNGLPVVHSIVVTNQGAQALRDLTLAVSAEPDFAEPLAIRLAEVNAGARQPVKSVDLRLRLGFLESLTERTPGRLRFELKRSEDVLLRQEVALELCAKNDWPGLEVLPELLAAFALPNEPFVQHLLRSAAAFLQRWTGDPSLNGYQSGDPGRVLRMAGAIYAALQEAELSYVNPPATFADRGQRVRLPRDIGEHRLATCLDLALIAAACLEQAGLHPLLVLVEGHAFCGVWLHDECFPDPVLEEPLRIRKRVELEEIAVFDPTATTARPSVDFDGARAEAKRRLAAAELFRSAIDVTRSRRGGVLPLPSYGVEPPGAPTDAASISATPTEAPTLDRIEEQERLRRRGPMAGQKPSSPESRLDHWRRKLLDLSMRNRLLNFKPNKRTIQLLCPDPSAFEDALADNVEFRIQPRPTELETDGHGRLDGEDRRAVIERLEPILMEEMRQKRLRADLDGDELDKRLVTVYREARTAMEEGGTSSLFLAVGFLRFVEKGKSTARFAPILLLPVDLTRTSVRQGFRLSLGGDEPRINATLLELLKRDHGIQIDGLDPLPEDDSGLDVPRIFHLIREHIRDEDRWELVEETALGLFSFAKILLWKDLAERSDELLRNPVVRHLVERSKEGYDDGIEFPDSERLDTEHPARETICPLSADSSQLAAVFAAANGKSFVLEGPPGTGKSQTIANLIAHCTADGKSVLFVSEKMAALEVVHDRLQKIGLGEACLELHSNKAKKKAVLDQLRASIGVQGATSSEAWSERAEEVDRLRKNLNGYVAALHRPRASGESVFGVLSRLIGLRDLARIELEWTDIEETTRERLRAARQLAERAEGLADSVGVGPASSLRGIGRSEYTPQWDRDARSRLDAFSAEAGELLETVAPVLQRLLGGEAALDDSGWTALAALAEHLLHTRRAPARLLIVEDEEVERAQRWVRLGRKCSDMREDLGTRYEDDPIRLPLDELDRLSKESATSWWFGAWSRRRKVRSALRSLAREPKRLGAKQAQRDLVLSLELRGAETELGELSEQASALLGEFWRGRDTDWDAIERGTRWAARCRGLLQDLERAMRGCHPGLRERCAHIVQHETDELRPGQLLHGSLDGVREGWGAHQDRRRELEHWLDSRTEVWSPPEGTDAVRHARDLARRWLQGWGEVLGWCRWQELRGELIEAGLAGLVIGLEEGAIVAEEAARAFERSYAEDWYTAVVSGDPDLRAFYSPDHERTIERFRRADQELLDLTRHALRSRVYASTRLPPNAPGSSEPGILSRELTKKRRHMAIRRLFAQIPTTLRRLKPCVLMSPLSVAQYLDPSHPPFDLVVFDEASQIPIWDAIGAIARGRQAVIVGDPKQLPPTSFFDRTDDDDELDDEVTEDMESILDECRACNLPVDRLRWHYRSRHESLIAFSNRQYYENGLVTFPSCNSKNLGVSWRYVEDGVFDRGKSRTNRREAEVVVDEVVRRLTDPVLGRYSIGVVSFSQSQQVLIQDLLEQARRSRPELDQLMAEDRPEPLFVKNLENVQGDERDTILFSIGYGPDAAGRVYMNFGPMNKSGGERRLNVAVTRAKREVVVISSLRGDQIDLSRTQQRGVRDLKLFLEYAQHGPEAFVRAAAPDPSGDPDSPFEEQVAASVRDRGWTVHTQVGCSGYRIDLAVVDPEAQGRYLLGIECDGASYHSAKVARDRDRLRQLVLEELGWRLHRVWSTDWWRDPTGETEKIERAIQRAKEHRAEDEAPTVVREPLLMSQPAVAEANTDPEVWMKERSGTQPVAVPGPGSAPSTPDPVLAEHVYKMVPLARGRGEFYDPSSTLAIGNALVRLVEAEGPITVDCAARRVGEVWGFARMRKKARVRILRIAEARRLWIEDDHGELVLWPPDSVPDNYRGFRLQGDNPGSQRSIAEIPSWEFANAAHYLLDRFGSIGVTDMRRETARLFGFKNLGSRVAARVEVGIDRLVRSGRAVREGELVRLP